MRRQPCPWPRRLPIAVETLAARRGRDLGRSRAFFSRSVRWPTPVRRGAGAPAD